MKRLLLLPIIFASAQSWALTCGVMTYHDQVNLKTVTIKHKMQTVFEETGAKYKVVLQEDGRYTLVLLKPGSAGMAAMTVQGQQLTLADADLNRTFACHY